MKEEEKHDPHFPDNATGLMFSIFFIVTLGVVGLASVPLASSRNPVSFIENRPLVPFPKFSWASLIDGNYTDSLGLFYSDNFPGRERLVTVAASIKDLGGVSVGFKYYEAAGVEDGDMGNEIPPPPKVDGDTTTNKTLGKAPEYNTSASIIVYEGRAIQIFGGNRETLSR